MMDQSPLEIALLRRSKWLIHALIISVMFNIALIATFSYFALHERKLTVSASESAEKSMKSFKSVAKKNSKVLQQYLKYSFTELVRELDNEDYVEEGQRHCDLALACLVAFHYFDVERALSGFPIEKRSYVLSQGNQPLKLTLFAGLNQDRLIAVRRFAQIEVWPLTPEGLFLTLKKKQGEMQQGDLIETFCLTSEFHLIERAFSRLPFLVTRGVLLQLLLEAEWKEIAELAAQVHHHPEGKVENLGHFLSQYIEKNSKLAAHLLTGMEPEYALKQLPDVELEKLIQLLEEKTPEVEAFFKLLAGSLRADHLRKHADDTLHEWTGKRFSPPKSETSRRPSTYVVQYGDSLWKISRDLGVSIAKLKEFNQLDSDVLTPGKELLIP